MRQTPGLRALSEPRATKESSRISPSVGIFRGAGRAERSWTLRNTDALQTCEDGVLTSDLRTSVQHSGPGAKPVAGPALTRRGKKAFMKHPPRPSPVYCLGDSHLQNIQKNKNKILLQSLSCSDPAVNIALFQKGPVGACVPIKLEVRLE